jgi:hypothetical protein
MRSVVFPTRTDKPIQQLITSSSTPEDYFSAQLEDQINKLNQIGIANGESIARYNTTIENDSYLSLFNASGTRTWLATSTLICSDNGENKVFPFGAPEMIGSNLDVPSTENVLRDITCTGLRYPDDSNGVWFSLPPHYSAEITNDIPISAVPTETGFFLIYFILSGLWMGFLVLLKEMVHFIKNGFAYFWK